LLLPCHLAPLLPGHQSACPALPSQLQLQRLVVLHDQHLVHLKSSVDAMHHLEHHLGWLEGLQLHPCNMGKEWILQIDGQRRHCAHNRN